MRKPKSDEIYRNRAVSDAGRFQDVTGCENCLETLVFAMRDKHHKFSVGLTMILSCLAIAEREGHVPKLPPDWWAQVRTYYP